MLVQEKRPRNIERVADPAEADELVREHLLRLGDDPAALHETHHFLYLPTPDDADTVARALDRDGWSTSIEESEDAWLVTALRTYALTPDAVRDTRAQLTKLAAMRGGVYDGWEAVRQ
jgi:regulator of RNase E activity RraB